MAQTATPPRKAAKTGSSDGKNGPAAASEVRAEKAKAAKAKPPKAKPPHAKPQKAKPPQASRKAKSAGRRAKGGGSGAKTGAGTALELLKPTGRKKLMAKLAVKLAKRAAKKMAPDLPEINIDGLTELAERAVAEGRELMAGSSSLRPQLPIQRSIDVAVPLQVAWEEWMKLEFLPEGVDTVRDIEREGTELVGEITGTHRGEWHADIVDERPEESFAWRSTQGSDCAGLITFHRLGKRLTRLELNLDVMPTAPTDTIMLATHLADRRAQSALRRFKARVELISPDEYEDGDRPRRR